MQIQGMIQSKLNRKCNNKSNVFTHTNTPDNKHNSHFSYLLYVISANIQIKRELI